VTLRHVNLICVYIALHFLTYFWYHSVLHCSLLDQMIFIKPFFLYNIEHCKSSLSQLLYGVHQGSVFNPHIFILYTTPLSTVISNSAANHHLYADDTQLLLSFSALNFSHNITHLDTLLLTYPTIEFGFWEGDLNSLSVLHCNYEIIVYYFRYNEMSFYCLPEMTS